MSAIDFPNTPTLNQLFSVGNRAWQWTGQTWSTVEQVVVGPAGPASTVQGPTGPTGPSGGPTGPIGPTGATGANSTVQGPTGPTGPASVVVSASTTVSGIVQLSTSAQTLTGTDANRAVTPASLAAFLPGTTGIGVGKSFTSGRGSLDAQGQIFQNNGLPVLSQGEATGDNLILNASFRVNQRNLSSGVSSTGYFLDMWRKAFATAPLTWLTGDRERILTLGTAANFDTITQQIEANRFYNGVHTLSWSGTAQGRVYSTGTFISPFYNSPYTFDHNLTGNMVIEFIGQNATLANVKLERGPRASPFIDIPINQDLANCQRYFWRKNYVDGETIAMGHIQQPTASYFMVQLPVPMRTNPTISFGSGTAFRSHQKGIAIANATSATMPIDAQSNDRFEGAINHTTTNFAQGGSTFVQANGTNFIAASAEL